MTTKALAMTRSHKAARLVSGGHVRELEGRARVFEVHSPDSGETYTVVVLGDAPKLDAFCNCRYGSSRKAEQPECSHAIAAKVFVSRPADPFVGLPSADHPHGRPA